MGTCRNIIVSIPTLSWFLWSNELEIVLSHLIVRVKFATHPALIKPIFDVRLILDFSSTIANRLVFVAIELSS